MASKACKAALLKELGLPHITTANGGDHPNGRPLLSVLTRLTEQKGLPLIVHGIRVALQKGAQVNSLGLRGAGTQGERSRGRVE